MSRHDYAYIGFGIPTDKLSNCTLEGVTALTKLCSKEIQDQVADATLEEILSEEFDTFESGFAVGIPALFIEAIRIKENVRLQFVSGDSENVVIFEPIFPWYLNCLTKEEKALDESSLNELLIKYQKILGLEDKDIFQADYQTVVGYC